MNKLDYPSIIGDSINELSYNVFSRILTEGDEIKSRNGSCLELTDTDLYLLNPRRRHLKLTGRTNNIIASIAETLWVLSGDTLLYPLMSYFLPRSINYSDDKISWRGCFTGDTKISLLNGTEIPIKDLIGKKEFWVYSKDKSGNIVPGHGHSAKKTKSVHNLIEITLDNNESFRCTPDHLILTRENKYIEAQNLKKGDSLSPLYRSDSTKIKSFIAYSYKDYELVKHDSGKWELTHLLGILKNTNMQVHHKDFNHRNNDPSNKSLLSNADHRRIHSKQGREIQLNLFKNDLKYHDIMLKKINTNLKLANKKIKNLLKSSNGDYIRTIRKNNINKLNNSINFKKKSHIGIAAKKLLIIYLIEGDITEEYYYKYHKRGDFINIIKYFNNNDLTNSVLEYFKTEFNDKYLKYVMEDAKKTANKIILNEKRKKELFISDEYENKRKSCNYSNKQYITKKLLKVLTKYNKITEGTFNSLYRGENGLTLDIAWEAYDPNKNLAIQLNDFLTTCNHKIKSIKNIILKTPIDVYDISVDKYHNFALSAGVFVHNSYGPRIYKNDQIEHIIKTFDNDSINTRRATMTIWRPDMDTQSIIELEGYNKTLDMPCTQWLGFFIRNKKLHLKVQFRSNDGLYGMSGINIFEFTILQELILELLKSNLGNEFNEIDLGYYHHSSLSLHIYKDKTYNQIERILSYKFHKEHNNTNNIILPKNFNYLKFKEFFKKLYYYLCIIIIKKQKIDNNINFIFNAFDIPTKNNQLYHYAWAVENYIFKKSNLPINKMPEDISTDFKLAINKYFK